MPQDIRALAVPPKRTCREAQNPGRRAQYPARSATLVTLRSYHFTFSYRSGLAVPRPRTSTFDASHHGYLCRQHDMTELIQRLQRVALGSDLNSPMTGPGVSDLSDSSADSVFS
jgi:hypothetical protein